MSSYQLAMKITNKLIDASKEESYQKNKDWYRYGIEIILTTVGGAFGILLTALILGIGKSVLAYVLPFGILRLGMGGQHAKTHSRCITYFICIMLAVIVFAKVLAANFSIAGILMLIFYNLFLLIPQMRMNTEKNNIIKSVGKATALFINVAALIGLIVNIKLSVYMIIALGALAVELTSIKINGKSKAA